MEKALNFLKLLRENNNKEWFDLHRSEWKEIQASLNIFTEQLIEGISSFDTSIKGLTIRDCTYRINRDTRFGNNKTPYKTHIGIFIAPKGKKSGYAGYYFHIEPAGGDFIGFSSIAAGLYMPEPVILRSVRDEILDNGTELHKSIENSDGFTINNDYKLKRTPRGFPTDSEFDELLKLKFFIIEKPINDSFILSDNLLDRLLNEFKKTTPFLNIINRAVKFGYEEMM